MNKIFFLLTGIFLIGCANPDKNEVREDPNKKLPSVVLKEVVLVKEVAKRQNCPAAKEFIEVYDFLLNEEYLENTRQMRKVSYKVAQGCKGSAKRFKKVMQTLIKNEIPLVKSIKLSMRMSTLPSSVSNAYVAIFTGLYSNKELDMPLGPSLAIAKSLSVDYLGDAKIAESDFNNLVSFCMKKDSLDLPKPTCAKFASRIAKHGEKYKTEIYPVFVAAYNFIKSSDGPELSTFDALRISENIAQNGPQGVENFVLAYEYGVSPKGLGLKVEDALVLANQLGSKGLEDVRLPASETE